MNEGTLYLFIDRVTPLRKRCEMNSYNYSEKTQHLAKKEKQYINKYINWMDWA